MMQLLLMVLQGSSFLAHIDRIIDDASYNLCPGHVQPEWKKKTHSLIVLVLFAAR